MSTALLWFRNDLRLRDNTALAAACRNSQRLLPLYIHDTASESPWPRGEASRWWLHHSLKALGEALRARGSRLTLHSGDTATLLLEIARRIGADRIYTNRRYEPHLALHDARCGERLAAAGIELLEYGGALLCEPEGLLKENGEPYRVFTPFWKAFQRRFQPGQPLAAPDSLPPLPRGVAGTPLSVLQLLPETDWDQGIKARWTPGESAAHRRLRAFLDAGLAHYPSARDRPAIPGTSSLSPHLAFGEISPRAIAYGARQATAVGADATGFIRQLLWREFACHTLHHFPETSLLPMDPRFRSFPWEEDTAAFAAWCRGKTGIPLVDAGLRELWRTGWMHNRARMVAASFLTKHLLVPWQHGARWFWNTLVDADLANNTMGWQWVAGCGVDAAPYFRIFNPVRQGERFDPDGDYVRRWVPELRRLDVRWIHQPWGAPDAVLQRAGIRLDRDYPRPVIDLESGRQRALERYGGMKQTAAGAS